MEISSWSLEEIEIVRELCQHQFSSLRRLYYNKTDDSVVEWAKKNMIEAGVSEEEFKKSLVKRARLYSSLKKNPTKLHLIGDDEMPMLKNVLSVFEDEYEDVCPQVVKSLWAKFFLYDKLRNFSNN